MNAGAVCGRRLRFTAAVLFIWAVAGCGAGSPDSTTSRTTGNGPASFCEAVVNVDMAADTGPADLVSATPETVPDAVNTYSNALRTMLPGVEATAPEQLAADVATLGRLNVDAAATSDPGVYRSPEFRTAERNIDTYVLEHCDFSKLQIVTGESGYLGVPDEPRTAGTSAIDLTNAGDLTHAAVVLRIDDVEKRPIGEILALPPEQMREVLDPVGSVRVDPGETSTVFLRLPAGRYALLCPVPKPTPPAPSTTRSAAGAPRTTTPPPPPAPPHYTEGEFGEFDVADPQTPVPTSP